MDAPDQPATNWQTELRRKSVEELLRILHDSVGDATNENVAEEIRKIFVERKVDFAPGSSPSRPPPVPIKYSTRGTVLVLVLNIVVLGPLLVLIIWPISATIMGTGGDFIGAVPTLIMFVPTTILTGAFINAVLFFACRRSQTIGPAAPGFLAGIFLWLFGVPIIGFICLDVSNSYYLYGRPW
jgi:hypothetical protein